MAKSKKKNQSSTSTLTELVTVAFAEDKELAVQYKQLLNDNDIPAAVKIKSGDESGYDGIAVMVSEEYLDEAHVIIESQASMGDFYDMAFLDDEYDEFSEESFDDEDY